MWGMCGSGTRVCALLTGSLVAVCLVSDVFVFGKPWFSLLGAVRSFAGIALMADALLGLLLCRWRRVLPWVAAAFALVCSVACLSELSDYRDTYQADQKIAQTVLSALEQDQVTS